MFLDKDIESRDRTVQQQEEKAVDSGFVARMKAQGHLK